MAGNNNGRLTNAIGESLSPAAIKLTVPVSDHDRFELWSPWCSTVDLTVEGLDNDGAKIGLTEEAIETAVRSRLRSARIYGDAPLAPWLYVNVAVLHNAFNVTVQLNRSMEINLPFWRLPEGVEPLVGYAVTWQAGTIGTHTDDPSYILSSVERIADRFIDEYLRVNADACK